MEGVRAPGRGRGQAAGDKARMGVARWALGKEEGLPTPPAPDLERPYIRALPTVPRQTAPLRRVNMNALIVLSVAALAACGNAQYFGYPGLFYNYPGLYSGAYPAAVTLKAAPETVTLKTVAPAPLTYSVAAVAPVAPIQSQFHAQDEIGQYLRLRRGRSFFPR
ncbi:hypothetical protein C7M84_010978 [Penaeus vannamei]|uniref:Uncharacterized protein n=1 Tax=Penaeus vannamei TaxID=6689 RepID=A0A423T2F3_PENVA|nr:hypothetical protein C7M84_010978 [Penaeus vannamei]